MIKLKKKSHCHILEDACQCLKTYALRAEGKLVSSGLLLQTNS